jgi:hypothetical protein
MPILPDYSHNGTTDNYDELSPPRRRGETSLHADAAGDSLFPKKGDVRP